jgi:hypothetical protein
MPRLTEREYAAALALAGVVLLVIGASLIALPLGFIVAGALALIAARRLI